MTDWNFYVLILIILEYIYIKKWHVHSPDLLGLNPYYTGIHLHKIVTAKQENTYVRLNPYYTGIHLHGFDRSGSPQCKCVLILIILEYIYIQFRKTECKEIIRLNPYYTGIHLHLKKAVPLVTAKVLILIILEYIYIIFYWP